MHIIDGMKLGYPGINLGLGCTPSHTFRLASISDERVITTAQENIDCMRRIIAWNADNGLLFTRISSSIIPFASHPAMSTDWQSVFKDQLAEIGEIIHRYDMRISMHPGQFVVLNSPSENVYRNSVQELQYHADFLDLLGLDQTHKMQIHLGGLHGDPAASMQLFIERYNMLPASIRRRLVIENDERTASVQDCLRMSEACGIPVLFDTLHHEVNNNGETLLKGLTLAMTTWKPEDGIPIIDYSTQNEYKKTGAHAVTLDVEKFRSFVKSLRGRDIDIMFEIKNKEASALQALIVLQNMTVT